MNSNAIGFKTSPKTLITFGNFGTKILSPSLKIVFEAAEVFGEKSPAIRPRFSGSIEIEAKV